MKIKKFTNPIRRLLGKMIISPLDQRVLDLEASIRDLQLDNALIYKAAAFIAADKIKGDYLEFGVFAGNSFITAYKCICEAYAKACAPDMWNTDEDCHERQILWHGMRFFAFDSFEGLPIPTAVDLQSKDFSEGKFACSEEEFHQNLSNDGIPLERVVTVPGWFEETLVEATKKVHNLSRAAIVHIDADYYQSARIALEFVTSLLVDGTVIIFDDWYNFKGDPCLGEQRAFQEWQAAHPELSFTQFQKGGPWGNSFIVHLGPNLAGPNNLVNPRQDRTWQSSGTREA